MPRMRRTASRSAPASRRWRTGWVIRRARFDAAQDVAVVTVDDKPIAYGWTTWVDTTDGVRDYSTRGHVHPAWRRRGIGTAILRHNEARLRRLAAEHATDRPRFYSAFAPDSRGRGGAGEGQGYEPARYFFDMRRPNLDEIEVPPARGARGPPDRPVASRCVRCGTPTSRPSGPLGRLRRDRRRVRALAGRPGPRPGPLGGGLGRDQIAGAVTNVITSDENAAFGRQRGWLDSVFVRRAWRRPRPRLRARPARLVRLREGGDDEAMLGVDSDNPSRCAGPLRAAPASRWFGARPPTASRWR